MVHAEKKYNPERVVAIVLLVLLIAPLSTSCTGTNRENIRVHHHEIISAGISFVKNFFPFRNTCSPQDVTIFCFLLETWLSRHADIQFATYIEPTMTICFKDGTYILLLDIYEKLTDQNSRSQKTLCSPLPASYIQSNSSKKATILNPSEYLYGNRHCKKIIQTLLHQQYSIIYQADENVDLTCIKTNLTSEIIYINTHAGYWDLDGDHTPDVVVIGTGERWTEQTPLRYQFELDHHMIVEGMVGDASFVCFTPFLITHYYQQDTLPHSLIYMATCHACYDDSMAQAFLTAGADVYLGWTKNTAFWINSKTSIQTFHLFALGCTAQQICRIIRYGGFMNRIVNSTLVYYGDGTYKLS